MLASFSQQKRELPVFVGVFANGVPKMVRFLLVSLFWTMPNPSCLVDICGTRQGSFFLQGHRARGRV